MMSNDPPQSSSIEKVSLLDPHFQEKVYHSVDHSSDPEFFALLDAFPLQESLSVRNVLKTRKLAQMLITEKGDLNFPLLYQSIEEIQQNLYSIAPNQEADAIRDTHLLKTLQFFQKEKEASILLKSTFKPHSHPNADQIIRETLNLPSQTLITDIYARKAVLSASLCYLRQSVGSCFGTAPAIIIHQEQPLQFLMDVRELFATGQLKRIVEGEEYAVPMSNSWGGGALHKAFPIINSGKMNAIPSIWTPGLSAAINSLGLSEKKVEFEKELISKAISSLQSQGATFTTSDRLIKTILLNLLGLEERDLIEFEERSSGSLHSSLFASPASKIGGKGGACLKYYQSLEIARSSFKKLEDNALLKSWEFTLASFSEIKGNFAKWNFYSSLGFQPTEEGGIGQILYQFIQKKLERINEQVQRYQQEYEQLYLQLKYAEGRLQNSSSEKEMQWLKADYLIKRNELHSAELSRDQAHSKAQQLSHLYDDLIDLFYDLFPRYFQEVYDPEMRIEGTGPYDDSPAGFRLLYKHGRTNTSQWSAIYTPKQFIESLVSFFLAAERQIHLNEQFYHFQNELAELTTAIVHHLRSDAFIETAFHRMALAHKAPLIVNPLQNLEKIDKKPWSYTSGGTINHLMTVYFRLKHPPTESVRWVESPLELLIFLIDTIKEMPPYLLESYSKESQKSLLIHSPTHAFLLKVGNRSFQKGWNSKLYTYTWARDQVIAPMERFLERQILSEGMMQHLIKQCIPLLPINFHHYFQKVFSNLQSTMKPYHFREYILSVLLRERGLQINGEPILAAESIDSLLYASLPIFPASELKEKISIILPHIPEVSSEEKEKILQEIDKRIPNILLNTYVDAQQLRKIILGLLLLVKKKIYFSINYPLKVLQIARELGDSFPEPVIFADSNWVKDFFSFLVNPGTGSFELWKTDQYGMEGTPMTSWQVWVNGSRTTPTWGVYPKPYEYTAI